MIYKITNKNGFKLNTKNLKCNEDLIVVPGGILDLLPENIKSGVEICGVSGNIEEYNGEVE